MNYFNRYYSFIAENKVDPEKYKDKLVLECHHIIPKHLGGPRTNIDNLVWLTHDNHVLAHMLLNIALVSSGNFKAAKRLGYGYSQHGIKLLELHGYLQDFMITIAANKRKKKKNAMQRASLISIAKNLAKRDRKNYTAEYMYTVAGRLLSHIASQSMYFNLNVALEMM